MNVLAVFEPIWTVSLLPPGATPWERAVESVDADLVARDPLGLIPVARSDVDTPLSLLPYLAAERSVNEFDGAWSEARQRAVTRGSFAFHRVQGTRPALDRALTPLGYRIGVVEWFERIEYRRPYTFRITVDLDVEPWSREKRSQLIRVANGAKSLHTKLDAIELHRTIGPAIVAVGGLVTRRRTLHIRQVPVPITVRVTGFAQMGALLRVRRTIRVKPRV